LGTPENSVVYQRSGEEGAVSESAVREDESASGTPEDQLTSSWTLRQVPPPPPPHPIINMSQYRPLLLHHMSGSITSLHQDHCIPSCVKDTFHRVNGLVICRQFALLVSPDIQSSKSVCSASDLRPSHKVAAQMGRWSYTVVKKPPPGVGTKLWMCGQHGLLGVSTSATHVHEPLVPSSGLENGKRSRHLTDNGAVHPENQESSRLSTARGVSEAQSQPAPPLLVLVGACTCLYWLLPCH